MMGKCERSAGARRWLLAWVSVLLLSAAAATPAAAWKPKTHVYLAEQAMRDAVDDGKVTLYETDYATGKIVGVLGAFEANPAVVAALRERPRQFRAGVVGPDAYPDILTGQQLIHPGTNKTLLGDPANGETPSAPGADAWLTYLWRQAYGRQNVLQEAASQGKIPDFIIARDDTPEIRAFVAGYITHAAGDMFMHTFVNHYAGGDFAISPDPKNAIKHIVLEGYVGARTPDLVGPVSIDGVDGFIYRHMIRAAPGTVLEQRLLQGAGEKTSLPAIFSRLRNGLQQDVDRYDRERMARSGPARVAYSAANGPEAEYKRAWIHDIDEGLRAWPKTSHQIALALVYSEGNGGADPKRAKEIATKYMEDHLVSMAGVPDFAVATVVFIRKVTSSILPAPLQEALSQLTKAPLEWMIKESTGRSLDEWASYIKSPEVNFDPVMNAPGGGHGGRKETLVTLAAFNRGVLKIDDPAVQFPDRRFKIEDFPPAFNTVQMTKLMFLSERGMNDLLAALRAKGVKAPAPPGLPGKYENAMLGFLSSLDGDNRWQGLSQDTGAPTGHAFFLARGDAGGWRRLFLRQIGERGDWPEKTAPDAPPTAPLDDTGFQDVDAWAARVDKVAYDAAGGGRGRNVVVTATFRNDGADARAFNETTVRTQLDNQAGSPTPQLRMSFVDQDEATLPAWHYLPGTPIPPKGRITVRFAYEVGDFAAQRQVRYWSAFEQRLKIGALPPFKYVDGKSVRIPVSPLGSGDAEPGPSPTEPTGGVVRGPAPEAFVRAGYFALRLDAAGRRGGPTSPVEVAFTARNYQGKRQSLHNNYTTVVLVGSDGVEYKPDGNVYGRSGADHLTYGRSVEKDEQVALTYVFPGPPRGVTPARLLVRDQKALVGEFYLQGAPSVRPTYAPLPDKGGIPAGQPMALTRVEARLVSLNRGDDGDWEGVISLRNTGGPLVKLTVSDIDMAIFDPGGETRHRAGNFYFAENKGRLRQSDTIVLLPRMEFKVRVWFPDTRDFTPARYKILENYGDRKEGPIPPSFLAAGAR